MILKQLCSKISLLAGTRRIDIYSILAVTLFIIGLAWVDISDVKHRSYSGEEPKLTDSVIILQQSFPAAYEEIFRQKSAPAMSEQEQKDDNFGLAAADGDTERLNTAMLKALIRNLAILILFGICVTLILKYQYEIAEKQRQADKAERERLQAQDILDKLFIEGNTAKCILRCRDGVYVNVNKEWEKLFGYSRDQALGVTAYELGITLIDSSLEHFVSRINDRSCADKQQHEISLLNRQGEYLEILAIYNHVTIHGENHVIITAIDISDRKEMERKHALFDRLNLVGEMAAGIGHEVRNPMTTVRGYLQFFQHKEKFAEYKNQLRTMIEELDRANAIITEFLSLAKEKMTDLKIGNLNGTIHALFPLLQADAFRLGHELQADIGDIPPIFYDEKEIRQLILNLVRNGFEAMDSDGILTIKTCNSGFDEIILSIQDTGKGIPKEILHKISTPFFTTKDSGTGLGLPVCYRIAERHKAKIEIATSSEGTTFSVIFAATKEAQEY